MRIDTGYKRPYLYKKLKHEEKYITLYFKPAVVL